MAGAHGWPVARRFIMKGAACTQGGLRNALDAALEACALQIIDLDRPPRFGLLEDGKRLHLQDGPIDLVIDADGSPAAIAAAYAAAISRFAGLLDELCAELTELRSPACADRTGLTGKVALRMHRSVAGYSDTSFITPMAAVAGSVADEILHAMLFAGRRKGGLSRAMVNNGGDIAFWLEQGQSYGLGLVDRPESARIFAKAHIGAEDRIGGIATSGFGGRSFTLGIADAVTVLATCAADADAAATIIANAVDLPGHLAIVRKPAHEIQPDNDLGALAVTRNVGELTVSEIKSALQAGARMAERHMNKAGIAAVCLHLRGHTITCGWQSLLATSGEYRNA